jgi:ABC-type transport system involved in cytochrome c biogenesis permease subunit
MTPLETTFFYISMALCLALSVLSNLRKGLSASGYLLMAFAVLVFEGTAIGVRWSSTGHPPVFGTFEEALSASWAVILFAIILDRKGRYAHIAMPIAALTMLYGLAFDTTGMPVTISEKSLWVDFHALFAWISWGFYTFSFICAVGVLSKRPWAEGSVQNLYTWLVWGFFTQTIMFVLGSYYSILLYGSWWVWDSVEYLFVVSWFLYAIPIHGKILYGWDERRLAKYTVLATVANVVLYWGLIYFPWSTYHIFDVEFKIHG